MDEKWTRGEGGSKKAEMGGRPLYKPPNPDFFGTISKVNRAILISKLCLLVLDRLPTKYPMVRVIPRLRLKG